MRFSLKPSAVLQSNRATEAATNITSPNPCNNHIPSDLSSQSENKKCSLSVTRLGAYLTYPPAAEVYSGAVRRSGTYAIPIDKLTNSHSLVSQG